MTNERLRETIRKRAFEAGFDAVRFTGASLPPETGERLDLFLARNRHGDMGWMKARKAERASLSSLWPAARSAIALGLNYGPKTDPLEVLLRRDRAAISVYAQNRDYHDVVKKRLKQIGRWLSSETNCELKVFVDTAPVMEKPLAAQAGLGWQGKHTNLVSREFGSWLFLGVILTTLDLPPDDPETDHCGQCQRCLEICPTRAFPEPYQLDARRCISYLTIEHKGPIPTEFRQAIGNRIYGCDDCLAVCPWNKFAQRSKEAAFRAREDLAAPLLAELATLDDAGFRQRFSGSPIKRIGRDRFVRNVAIALGNSGEPGALSVILKLIDDQSPLVRGAAIWAMRRLISPAAFDEMRTKRIKDEMDPDVRQEWSA